MRALAERAWFGACLVLGRRLRSARYAAVRIVHDGAGATVVRKHRVRYAPVLVWLGAALMRVLGTGVRVLPQRAWEERECRLHRALRDAAARVEGATLVLPYLPGRTLADLLDDPAVAPPARTGAMTLAAAALADLHRRGVTHGDAMAENVVVDLDAGVAHWFDFETEHEPHRAMTWRRADDVRALLATCVLRTGDARRAATVRLIVDGYGDEAVAGELAARFTTPPWRALPFHLGQAPLSPRCFREVGRLLSARAGVNPGR